MDIGAKIKALRIQNDLTLEELASRSELTKGFLSQVERNLTSPSVSTLEDILEALGTDLASFFKESKRRSFLANKIISLMSMKNIVFIGSYQMRRKMKWNLFCWNSMRIKPVWFLILMMAKNLVMYWKDVFFWLMGRRSIRLKKEKPSIFMGSIVIIFVM